MVIKSLWVSCVLDMRRINSGSKRRWKVLVLWDNVSPSNKILPYYYFKELGNREECHNVCLDIAGFFTQNHTHSLKHTLKHTAGHSLPLSMPGNRCCATSCLAWGLQPPPPFSLRLSPWAIPCKYVSGPLSLPLSQRADWMGGFYCTEVQ